MTTTILPSLYAGLFAVSRALRLPLAAFVLLAACMAAPAASFEDANRLYDQGKYADAQRQYEQLVAAGQTSANLFYNLGNTEFRLGDQGKAALDYERALALNPSHPEAQANLKFVREEAGAHLLPRSSLDRVVLPWTARVYTVLATLSFWSLLFSGAFMLLWRRSESLSLWAVMLAAVFTLGYSTFALWRDSKAGSLAIVTAKEAVARLAPADREGVVETLPAASRVTILNERGEWMYCELPGRSRGWLPSELIERVDTSKRSKS